MRLTIDEYCKKFKMSREMINSKLRTKKLNYIIENSITYIIVTEKSMTSHFANNTDEEVKEVVTPHTNISTKSKTTVATVLALYQRENHQLKEKIVQLEAKVDKLIDDKEQMLRAEMQKIEQVYSAKDEQLKTILELVNTKLMMDNQTPEVHEIEAVSSELVELRSYIKTLELKQSQRKMIKKRFLAAYDSDVRVIQQNGKLYLDFSKYDYSDLLEY